MQSRHPLLAPASARSGGAVIVVVLTLMASLAFLGFFFYSWTDQEAKSARAFAFERIEDTSDDVDILDDALRQIIQSTPDNRQQSVLNSGEGTVNGRRVTISDKSLLAHTVGLIQGDGTPVDIRPRNGRGIAVYGTYIDPNPPYNGLPTARTAAEIDFDYNGDYVAGTNAATTREATGADFRLNFSGVASGGAPFDLDANPRFVHSPDVDYTYPDVNSQFLAYETTLPNGVRVVIPTFLRPQLFPDKRTTSFSDLYTNAATAAQVLRPHSQHVNIDGTTPRFIDPVTWPSGRPALSGDLNRVIQPFPFTVDANTNTVFNEMGVFSGSTQYDLDVDADGDGILDSIWLDLDSPLIDLPDGRQVVPIFYAKIIDADALINVNHHGQDPYVTSQSLKASANAFMHVYSLTAAGIHASNQGASPAEVSPLPALYADPNNTADIDPPNVAAATLQHHGIYADQSTGPPTDRAAAGFTRIQIANTELFRILHGSPEYRADLTYANANPSSDVPGRYGEAVTEATNTLSAPILRNALNTPSSGIFPSAGSTIYDDNRDDNNSTNDWTGVGPTDNISSGISHTDNFGGVLSPALTIPYSVHPRDFTGLGNYAPVALTYRMVSGTGAVRDLAGLESSMPINPSRWLYYGTRNTSTMLLTPALWQNLDAVPSVAIAAGLPTPWSQGGNPTLNDRLFDPRLPPLSGTPYDGLWNENDEIVTDSNFPTQVDSPFPVSEMPALLLSNQDWQLAPENSRLRKLASLNFEDSKRAEAIRRQFTTDSRDRLEHGHHRMFGEDTNGNGVLDTGEDSNNNTVLDDRRWEFNDLTASTGLVRFPPAFDTATPANAGGAYTSRHENGAVNVADPFRPVTRRLLTVEENNRFNIGGSRKLPGQKLNLNRLLVNFDRNGNPIYRHLTPHSRFQLADNTNPAYNAMYLTIAGALRPMSHENPTYSQSYYDNGQSLSLMDPDVPSVTVGMNTYPQVPYNVVTSDPFAQEVWARYDRQRLARDIYTLLYTLGGPDHIDPTTASASATNKYSSLPDNSGNGINTPNGIPDLVDAMAQFAVNYVDALDQDDVITRFEFDPDLSDGWNTSTVTPWAPSHVVYGVEAQQVALSEVLLVLQAPAATDNAGTLHKESDGSNNEHRWLYVELRNATPFTVPLPTGSYRLARYDQTEAARSGIAVPKATSEFRTTTALSVKQIGAGQNFIVACHDGTVQNNTGPVATSDFYTNYNGTLPGFEVGIPAGGTAVANASDDPVMTAGAPNADLDLVVTDAMVPSYSEFYRNTPESAGTALIEPLPSGTADPTASQFQLRLERRLNTNGFGFTESDANGDATWVEVDRFDVVGKPFTPAGETATDIANALQNLKSTERGQVFDEATAENNDTLNPDPYRHSLVSIQPKKHEANWAWGSFNSGNRSLGFTLWQPHFNRDITSVYDLLAIPVVGPQRVIAGLADASNVKMTGWMDSTATPKIPFTAEGYFRHPDGQTTSVVADDNRWYRVLEFIEYPPRANDTVRDAQSLRRRTDGRVSLNTLRQEPVLAGLVDDEGMLNSINNPVRPAQDRHDAGRNWFDQLLTARDGIDQLSGGLPLPGVPGAMPFRSLTYVDTQNNNSSALEPDPQLQNTILRNHLTTAGLGLLDARSSTDITNGTVDYYTKNRLLSKIANNTTNRSHVFAMWVGYELFEAHQPNATANPDIVQIGAKITDIPGHRDFVVVDMTRLEEAFVDDPNDMDGSGNPIPGRFDFRKFIIYRKRIK